ncbi:MAG TPA: signal peptide peptidase SppA [Flavobacteriaceae bacterium]|nr:signal peptide peptidase SppA [Flavobacteriaceae bacterium]
MCFFLLFIVGYFVSKIGADDTKVAENSILELRLNFPIQDNAGNLKFKDFPFLDENKKDGLFDLVNAIDYASTDDNIKGITIEPKFLNAGITQTKTLREALIRFKESGKFVTAYADIYTQLDYYLSSVADTIYINPVGDLDFRGLATELLYMKDIQEKTGVKMDVIRLGKYKSAVEPFLDSEMSEANREQISSYLNSIWSNLRKEIGESRNLDMDYLDEIANDLLARTPERAVEVGLADKIAYYSEYEAVLRNALGVKEEKEIERINLVDYTVKIGRQNAYKYNKDKIAVIYAQGEIVYGDGGVKKIGPKEMNDAIIKAKNDKAVKAIVLRVNSPGGSALTSELIWKELEEAKKVKPVIVSMGDFAASGGYYIAAGGDKIFAEPTTITGSIGVFGMLPNIKGLADKIGINAQQVTTNDNAILFSVFEEMTESQEEYIRENILEVYDLFKKRVADGRGMTLDEVEEIAQGRVWTGEEALSLGLVDALGGLDAALQYAAEQVDLENYQIKEYPEFNIDLQRMLRSYGITQTADDFVKEAVGEDLFNILEQAKEQTERKGVQLLFPYSTKIQ